MHGDNTLGTHTTRHGHILDKNVCGTEEFCRDRDFSVATDLGSDKKKKKKRKKRPPGVGASQIMLRFSHVLVGFVFMGRR